MAIDSREKRQAISGILGVLIAGVTPNASPDQEWRQEAGWSYPGILAQSSAVPPDDDAEVTVTNRTDADGATIRPPYVRLKTALDSVRRADLIGPHRLVPDREHHRWLRSGHAPNIGRTFVLSIRGNGRAGEALSL